MIIVSPYSILGTFDRVRREWKAVTMKFAMSDHPLSIPADRPLTSEERVLVRWLLEHANSKRDSREFLSQLEQARVVSQCSCGCASVDFAIGEQVPPNAEPLDILSDYWWEDKSGAKFGVFVFAKAGLLAGIEVYSIDGLANADKLPRTDSLK